MKIPSIELWLELETRCNLQCKFCYNYWKDGISTAPQRLTTEKMLEALANLFHSVDCEKIAISGGEPLLREDLYDILAFINDNRIPMVLTSNSILLSKHNINRLIQLGIVTFQLPLLSSNKALHDMLSGAESWQETLNSIVMLKEAGANVVPVFIATKINLEDFPNVLDICSILGIEEIIFNRFVPGGLGLRNQDLIGIPSENDLIDIIRNGNLKAHQLNLDIHLGVPIALPANLRTQLDRVKLSSCPVGAAQKKWTVDCEGNIRRCNHSQESIGNLLNGGAKTLLKELGQISMRKTEEENVRTCSFLGNARLIQIGSH